VAAPRPVGRQGGSEPRARNCPAPPPTADRRSRPRLPRRRSPAFLANARCHSTTQVPWPAGTRRLPTDRPPAPDSLACVSSADHW